MLGQDFQSLNTVKEKQEARVLSLFFFLLKSRNFHMTSTLMKCSQRNTEQYTL